MPDDRSTDLPLDLDRLRADTPGTASVVHLNNAGSSLPTRQVLDTVVGHLTGTVTSLTQNAVRGIPIGQSQGPLLLTAAHGWIDQVLATLPTLDENDLGTVAPGHEIAQMQHERLRARMFMS